jgi:hypothetical protein
MSGARLGWGLQVQSIAPDREVNLKNRGGGIRAKSGSKSGPNRPSTNMTGPQVTP